MLFRKPPQVKLPTIVEPMLENIDMSGTPLHMFALELAEEALKVGRVGVFVDFPNVDVGTTAADAKARNLRPSMKMYTTMSIINWKTSNINNANVLSMVVLKECVDIPKDEFECTESIQYRVLDLFQVGKTVGDTVTVEYQYRVRVFTINDKGEDVLSAGPFFPKVNGKELDYIPFQFMSVDDNSSKVDEPPLIDLVDMNLMHYRVTADYEHGCHFTGLPTPVISGYQSQTDTPETFCIGSTTAWVFPRPDAKATYLEFTGQGLTALKENLDKKEGLMAVLGARMLETTTKTIESADTASINRGGEQSMLSSVAQVISMGMRKSLKTFCEFAGAKTDEVEYELNRDFFPIPMDALTLTAIIAGWQNQAYSYESMFALFKKGEIVPTDADAKEEQKKIEANPPPMPDAAGKNGAPTVPGDATAKSAKPNATPATPAPTITQLQNKGGQN